MSTALDALLAPRSIAVVGASRTRGTIGAALFDNLLLHGFQGPVYPVNPGAAVVHSVKAYPSVSAIPDPVDLAVLMLAVVALVGQAYVINHLAGIDYPRWRANPT